MPARPSRALRVLKWLLATAVAGLTALALLAGGLYLYLAPSLPEIDQLRDVQLQEPLRVYSRDGELLAVYGTKRRLPLALDQIPEQLSNAFIAAEDDRFYEHPGVDWMGLTRAAVNLVLTGEKGQGGSTITMQVARNFFLSREKTYLRKLNEILLALKIERELDKRQILELYLNKIYLGQRAYGVGAAAQVYYGKEVAELTLPEAAMIAGLPKAPSRYNPVSNPTRALQRRNYVLRRMRELEMIDELIYETARLAQVTAATHGSPLAVNAPYVGEMARLDALDRFGDDVYTGGYSVYTTVVAGEQKAANDALRTGLLAYEERQGYRGPVARIEPERLPAVADLEQRIEALGTSGQGAFGGFVEDTSEPGADEPLGLIQLDDRLEEYPAFSGLEPAIVVSVAEQPPAAGEDEQAEAEAPAAGEEGEEPAATLVYRRGGRLDPLAFSGLEWALPEDEEETQEPGEEEAPKTAADVLAVGDVVHVAGPDAGLRMVQLPRVEGAFVALDPDTGAIRALTGGFSFERSSFNRATQARRQPGSNFKPFIYSAALARDYTPATLVNDAPIVFDDPALEDTWRPENYSGRVFGPTRLREGLVYSRNLVSIRVLLDIGIPHALRYLQRFGFPREQLPADLTLALGSAALTPVQIARGYAVLANGGFLIEPYLIERIEDGSGQVLHRANPLRACPEPCELKQELERKRAEEEQAEGEQQAGQEQQAVEAAGAEDADAAAAVADDGTAADPQGEGDAEQALPELEPRFAEQVIEPRNAYIVRSFLRDVARRGTGRRTRVLKRDDLGGKTGTTDDQLDAWFSGFGTGLVASAWVGYDELESLGPKETGARAALPIWIDFMQVALDGVPERWPDLPAGMVTVRIDPETGEYAGPGTNNALFEIFRSENAPEPPANGDDGNGEDDGLDDGGGSLF